MENIDSVKIVNRVAIAEESLRACIGYLMDAAGMASDAGMVECAMTAKSLADAMSPILAEGKFKKVAMSAD